MNNDINTVFSFFTNPKNLLKLTPTNMNFEITNEDPIEMKTGAEVKIKMKLFNLLPVKWESVVIDWNPPYSFTDVQPTGPYRYFHHTHKFEEVEVGVKIIDEIEYVVPGFFLEGLVQKFLVGPELKRIFKFRQKMYYQLLDEDVIKKKMEILSSIR